VVFLVSPLHSFHHILVQRLITSIVDKADWGLRENYNYVITLHWDGFTPPEFEFVARLDRTHVHQRCFQTGGRHCVFMNSRVIPDQDGYKIIECYIYSRIWNFHPYRMAFADGDADVDAVWDKVEEHIKKNNKEGTDLADSMAGHCCLVLNSGLRRVDVTPYHMTEYMGEITVMVEKCVRKRDDDRSVELFKGAPQFARFNIRYRSRQHLVKMGLIKKGAPSPKTGYKRPRRNIPRSLVDGDDPSISVAQAMHNFVNDIFPPDAKKPVYQQRPEMLPQVGGRERRDAFGAVIKKKE
jgi:hypothetical protein